MLIRHRPAAVALGAAAVAASLVPAASSYAAGPSCQDGPGPCIVVEVLDGSDHVQQRTELTSDDLSNLVDNPGRLDYEIRNNHGQQVPHDPVADVTSVAAVVGAAQVSLASVHYVEVFQSSTYASELSQKDLQDPGQQFEEFVPGFYQPTPGTTMGYVRPLRSDTDVNNRDYFSTGDHGALGVLVHTTGTLLDVTAQADAQTVKAGKPLRLSASVAPGEGVAPYTYAWDFAYGPDGSGRSVTHSWQNPGTYYVSVTATDSASPANHGLSNYLPIKVTCNPKTDPNHCGRPTNPPKPTTKPCPGCSGQEHGGHHGPHGPDQGGGRNPRGTGHHDSPTGGPTGSHQTGRAQGTNGSNTQTGGTSSGNHQKGRTHNGSTPGGGPVLSGRLLLAAQTYDVPQQRQAATKVSGARAPTPTHWSWPWRLTGMLILPALLGLGMAREAVQVRRRVARMGA